MTMLTMRDVTVIHLTLRVIMSANAKYVEYGCHTTWHLRQYIWHFSFDSFHHPTTTLKVREATYHYIALNILNL